MDPYRTSEMEHDVRDCDWSPVILSYKIHASVVSAGAAVFGGLALFDAPREFALGTGFADSLLVRIASLRFGLTLLRYRPRTGLPYP